MLNPTVGPLARHIIENIGDRDAAVAEIDAAITEARPKMFTIEGQTKVHLHDRAHGYELTGFLHYNGYQIDETRVFVDEVYFPHTLMLQWDRGINEGTMLAEKLITIDSMKERKVLGYQIMRDEGYTVFHLEEWGRDASIRWDELKTAIETQKEPA